MNNNNFAWGSIRTGPPHCGCKVGGWVLVWWDVGMGMGSFNVGRNDDGNEI